MADTNAFNGQLASGDNTVVPAVAYGVVSTIVKCTAYNDNASARTVIINIVNSGGSVATTNRVVSKTLQPGEAYTFPEVVGQRLTAGMFVSANASAASSVNLKIDLSNRT